MSLWKLQFKEHRSLIQYSLKYKRTEAWCHLTDLIFFLQEHLHFILLNKRELYLVPFREADWEANQVLSMQRHLAAGNRLDVLIPGDTAFKIQVM